MTQPEMPTDSIAETENYVAWVSEDTDGELTYHLELNSVTIHFFREEWAEFLTLIKEIVEAEGA